jgi:DNA-directed RNA polymerase I subunit RPA43
VGRKDTWSSQLLGKDSTLQNRLCSITLNYQTRLMVANEMLSLLGSIQFDPFSPEHVPEKPTVVPEHHTSSVETEQPFGFFTDDNNDSDTVTSPQSGRQGNGTTARVMKDKVEKGETDVKEKKKAKEKSKSRKKMRD